MNWAASERSVATDRHLFFLLRRFDDFFSPEFFFFSSPFLSVLRAYLEVSNVTEARQVIRMANYLWQRAAEGSQADGRREERGREGSGWSCRRGREERRKHDKTTGLLLPRPPRRKRRRDCLACFSIVSLPLPTAPLPSFFEERQSRKGRGGKENEDFWAMYKRRSTPQGSREGFCSWASR